MVSNKEINTVKSKFEHIYNLDDPATYYNTLCNQQDYLLPEKAKPYFMTIINAYLKHKPLASVKILDMGCS